MTTVIHDKFEYYPADLQESAKEAYEALPESGTVAQLVKRILGEFSIRESENNMRFFSDEGSYVQVGWKSNISIEPLGDEMREVTNIGSVQWFYGDSGPVMVCRNDRYVSNSSSSTTWETISDEHPQSHRELRWEIVTQN